jgi:glycosyltransferase involved in cell wall biosynthesis
VIFEAFAAGIPVVATNLGGMSEFVRHERDGLLFGLEDHGGLARQLRRLVEEPGLLERLRAGIEPVKTVQENVDELEVMYGGLLARV